MEDEEEEEEEEEEELLLNIFYVKYNKIRLILKR